jgi:membrane-bound ClpP family serine protease
VGLLVVPRLVAESRNPGRAGFDIPGAVTITAGMTALVYTLLEGASYGWTSATTLGLFTTAAIALQRHNTNLAQAPETSPSMISSPQTAPSAGPRRKSPSAAPSR